ncbi:MAG: hypothetical protein K1X92_11980 [Bacteroidia bacterium]|nr:hypothetical protein [Bacteroidia bacterium]
MNKILIAPIIFLLCQGAFAQQNARKSADQICHCLENINPDKDRKLEECLKKELSRPGIKKMPESKFEAFSLDLNLILSKNCRKFVEYYQEEYLSDAENQEWLLLDSIPVSRMSKAEIEDFFSAGALYYKDPSGGYTRIQLTPEFWTEYIGEGENTYSKCKIIFRNEADLSIAFVESNDPVKNKMSKKGDVYNYRLLEKVENGFICAAHYNGLMFMFKVYSVKPGSEKNIMKKTSL